MIFFASNRFSTRTYTFINRGLGLSTPPILNDLSALRSTPKFQGSLAPLIAPPIPVLPNRVGFWRLVYGLPDAAFACKLMPASANISLPNQVGPVYWLPEPYL